MGRFQRFVGQKLELDVEGEKIQIETLEEDRLRILAAQEMSGVEKYKEMFQCVVDMISRALPDEPEPEIRAVVSRNFEKMFMDLGVHWGWITNKDKEGFLSKRATVPRK